MSNRTTLNSHVLNKGVRTLKLCLPNKGLQGQSVFCAFLRVFAQNNLRREKRSMHIIYARIQKNCGNVNFPRRNF